VLTGVVAAFIVGTVIDVSAFVARVDTSVLVCRIAAGFLDHLWCRSHCWCKFHHAMVAVFGADDYDSWLALLTYEEGDRSWFITGDAGLS
jgi:hypothetical protein